MTPLVLQRKKQLQIITIILLTILIILSTLRLFNNPFSTNIFDLLPIKDRIISRHYDVLSVFEVMDQTIFELELVDTNSDFSTLTQTTIQIRNTLAASGFFEFSQEISPKDFFLLEQILINNWPNLFTKEDSIWLNNRLNKDSLNNRFSRTIRGLFTLSDQAAGTRTLLTDPFNFREILYKKLASFRLSPLMEIEEGFITNKERTRILFIAKISDDQKMQRDKNSLLQVIENAESVADTNKCRLIWMSGTRAALDNEKTIKNDINLTAPLIIILITLLCFLIYRHKYFGLLVFIPTLLGILFTLSLLSLLGKLSIIMLGFGAALLGITVDYSIHFFYYIDSNPSNSSPVKTLARPIIASALTTTGAFVALLFAQIPGLSQLGIMTALGILMVATLTLTILPLFFHAEKDKKNNRVVIKLADLFENLYDKKIHNKLLLPLIVCSILLWAIAPKIRFDGDPENLNGMSEKTIKAEKLLNDHWGGIQCGMYLVVSDSSLNLALLKTETILNPLIQLLNKKDLIDQASLISELLPSSITQQSNRKRWLSFWNKNPVSLLSSIIDSVTRVYGLPPKKFKSYIENLIPKTPQGQITIDSFPHSIKVGIISNSIRQNDSLWYVSVPVIPKNKTSWNGIDSLATAFDVLAVNDAVLGLRLLDLVKQGFKRSSLIIPIIILLILILIIRKPDLVLITLLAPICATGITLGLMSILSIPINIVTLMVFAFIFGLGIDYALMILHFSQQDNRDNYTQTSQAAASVTVAALTTFAGLGAMIFAKHPVLHVLGATGLTGILSSYICAIFIIPALINARVTEKRVLHKK